MKGDAKGSQKGGPFPKSTIGGHPASSHNAVMGTIKGQKGPGSKPMGGFNKSGRGGSGSKGIGSATPGPVHGDSTSAGKSAGASGWPRRGK